MIKIENICLTLGNKNIINNLNLTIEKGEKIAVIGPSGCGKSTLLRLIIGLIKPDKGNILIDDKNINHISQTELKKIRLNFGFLFQSSALFDSMNVFENVAFSLTENYHLPFKTIKQKVKEKLKMVEMLGTEKLMPSDLSGGMKKRIGLARAIAGGPQIMLYDEPTTGLDPIRSKNIEDLIAKLTKEMQVTSIVVTHQESTMLRTADKIYLMSQGKLEPYETPKSIFTTKNEKIQMFLKGES